MKKHILTGFLVALCGALVYYTSVYNRTLNGGVAQKHNSGSQYKIYASTTKKNQYDVFKRLVDNKAEVVDNTSVVTDYITVADATDKASGLLLPLPALNNNNAVAYNFPADEPRQLVNTKTGTKVNIQANSFVNELGELAEGVVTVSVREMHTAPEFFVAGMPMNGTESKGIIELNATDEQGNALYLNNEKPVEVLMASAGSTDGYNVFHLENTSKSWMLRKANMQQLKPAAPKVKKFSDYQTNISLAPIRRGHQLKKELRFKMYLNKVAYPELSGFTEVEWVYTGKNARKVQPELMKDRSNPYGVRGKKGGSLLFNYWTNVTLNKDDNGQYHMIFTKENEKLDIPVKFENAYGRSVNTDAMYDDYKAGLALKQAKQKDETEDLAVEETYEPGDLAGGYTNVTKFTIDEMGVWGINREVKYAYTVNAPISFTDEEGNVINPVAFYHYDAALNTYQTIPVSQAFSIKYNSKGNNVIFAVTGANQVAVLRKGAFDEIVAKSNIGYPLTTKLVTREVKTMDDVDRLFNNI